MDRHEIQIYFRKYSRLFWRGKQYVKVISAVIIAFAVNAVFPKAAFDEFNPTKNSIFALVCACLWIGIFNSIQTICQERPIIQKEHESGTRFSSFLFAHMLTELLVCLAETIAVTSVTYGMNYKGLVASKVFYPIDVLNPFLSIFLLIYASDMLGLMVSAFSRTPDVAMMLMPFALIVQLIFADYIFSLQGSMKKISNITVTKWGMLAIGNSFNIELLQNPMEKMYNKLIESNAAEDAAQLTAYRVNAVDYNDKMLHLASVWLALAALIVISAVLTYFFITLIKNDKR